MTLTPELLEKWTQIVEVLVQRTARRAPSLRASGLVDDLRQDLLLAMLKQSERANGEAGSISFVSNRLRGEVLDFWRRDPFDLGWRRNPEPDTDLHRAAVPVEVQWHVVDPHSTALGVLVEEGEQSAQRLEMERLMLVLLTASERSVLRAHLDGGNSLEVARATGLAPQSVRVVKYNAIRKLRAHVRAEPGDSERIAA